MFKNIGKILTLSTMKEKEKLENLKKEFWLDYVLMVCNKICGAGHSNMQLKVIVETQQEFNQWIEKLWRQNVELFLANKRSIGVRQNHRRLFDL